MLDISLLSCFDYKRAWVQIALAYNVSAERLACSDKESTISSLLGVLLRPISEPYGYD